RAGACGDQRRLRRLQGLVVESLVRKDGDLQRPDAGLLLVLDANLGGTLRDRAGFVLLGRGYADPLRRAARQLVVHLVEDLMDHPVADLVAVYLTQLEVDSADE